MSFVPLREFTHDSQISHCCSGDYLSARQLFLSEVEAKTELGGCPTKVQHYCNEEWLGVRDEALYTDVATFGDMSAENVIIISSGTHGIEGYVGSALQVALLRCGLLSAIPENCVVCLVHAINPFGFSHYRRTNEDNVDLNRNFIDFSKPLPVNDLYLGLRDYIQSNITSGACASEALACAAYSGEFGEKQYQAAQATGQYVDNKTIYFGGFKETWSNKTWRAILADVLNEKKLAVHLDIHSGLGGYGDETLIYTGYQESPGFEMACSCYGESELLIPGGRLTPDVNGPVVNPLRDGIKDGKLIAAAPEFGTVPLKKMLSVLLEENTDWLTNDGKRSESDDIVSQMRECFCPNDNDWRAKVWHQFRRRTQQALYFVG